MLGFSVPGNQPSMTAHYKENAYVIFKNARISISTTRVCGKYRECDGNCLGDPDAELPASYGRRSQFQYTEEGGPLYHSGGERSP